MKNNLFKILIISFLAFNCILAMEEKNADSRELSISSQEDAQQNLKYFTGWECHAFVKGEEGSEENAQNRELIKNIVENKKVRFEKELVDLVVKYHTFIDLFPSEASTLLPALEVYLKESRKLKLSTASEKKYIYEMNYVPEYFLLKELTTEEMRIKDQFIRGLELILARLAIQLIPELLPYINVGDEGTIFELSFGLFFKKE